MKNMPLRLTIITVGVLAIAYFVIERRLDVGGPAKVCLSGDVSMIRVTAGTCLSPKDIKSMLQAPVLNNNGQAALLKLTPPNSATQKTPVKTCADYIKKIGHGWYALSQREMDKEIAFTARCGLLTALAQATTPRQSYVNDPKGLANLGWLPESLLPHFGESSSEIVQDDSGRHERSVAALAAAGECTIRQAKPDFLSLVCNLNDVSIQELARADFNEDGFEDMLVLLSAKPTGGTASFSEVQGLTRRNPSSMLETFALDVR